MNILSEIVEHKKQEVKERRELFPEKLLEQSIYINSNTVSLKKYVLREDKSGIIAEFKRKSPSKGDINQHAAVEQTSIGYMQAGASALSILTDRKYFGGKNEDLTVARKFNFCPILRKDFVIDEYQVLEAKSIGADAILLIASVLEPKRLEELAKYAKTLGMEILMEVHSEDELLPNLNAPVDLIGVNNRNLKTFEVSIQNSIELAKLIPDHFVKVSESGLNDPENIIKLMEHGFQGFLIGEHFMANSRPSKACADFINQIKILKSKRINA